MKAISVDLGPLTLELLFPIFGENVADVQTAVAAFMSADVPRGETQDLNPRWNCQEERERESERKSEWERESEKGREGDRERDR